MRRNNRALYEKIMYFISKEIKHILNEEINRFDVAEYNEDPNDILDQGTISSTLNNGYEYINYTNILWSDLNVYTLDEIINDVPQKGYPIGINIIDNKYVSLKFMSLKNPTTGSKILTKKDKNIPFSNKRCDDAPNVIFGFSLKNSLTNNDDIEKLQVKIKGIDKQPYYKQPDKTIIKGFKYFNGKEQTDLILNDIRNSGDYPAAECVYEFNPGKTQKGDWYIPAIGELIQIYALIPVINYICQILKDKGFTNLYDKIYDEEKDYSLTCWTSTFYSKAHVYYVYMYGRINSYEKDTGNAVLSMYQLEY